jgi:hypothetical protein
MINRFSISPKKYKNKNNFKKLSERILLGTKTKIKEN